MQGNAAPPQGHDEHRSEHCTDSAQLMQAVDDIAWEPHTALIHRGLHDSAVQGMRPESRAP
jgi:hypothetical protein